MLLLLLADYSFVWKHRSTSITDKHMFRTCFLKLDNNRNRIAWGLGRRKTTRNGFDQGAVAQVVGGTCSPWEWTMSSSHITKPLTYPVFFFLFPFCLLMGEREREKGGAAAYVFWGVCLCTCHDEEHDEKVAPTEKMECLFSSLLFRNHLSGTETNPVSSLVFFPTIPLPPTTFWNIVCIPLSVTLTQPSSECGWKKILLFFFLIPSPNSHRLE